MRKHLSPNYLRSDLAAELTNQCSWQRTSRPPSYVSLTLSTLIVMAVGAVTTAPAGYADNDNNTVIPNNRRLNDSVVGNVYTIQHHVGCTNDVRVSPQLERAAQRQAHDVLTNRALDNDIGSDGSTPQDRAAAAGYRGKTAETVAINPAPAISGIEILNTWYYNPAYFTIMSNCANTQMGVWSENSVDRTVVVAVYGQPDHQIDTTGQDVPLGPIPDYDASDELQHGLDWLPWILRGVSPPPAIPPN